MAEKIQDAQRVVVRLDRNELNNLLIQPAKDAGFIDFDPTRVNVAEDGSNYTITFERVT